jgi:hypothetical protein
VAQTLNVSAKNAKEAAEEFVSQLQMPPVEQNRTFQLVTFANEEDCRFFYPRRAFEWQRQVNTYISRALRRKNIAVHRVTITPTDYHVWRDNRDDTDQLRREFADQKLCFIAKDC